MSLRCWTNSHSYDEVFSTDIQVADGVRVATALLQCERCHKYKVKLRVLYLNNNGVESSITLTTNGKKIEFLNGRSN